MFLNEGSIFPKSMEDFTVGSRWIILEQREGNCKHLKSGYVIEVGSNGSAGVAFRVIDADSYRCVRRSFKDGWLMQHEESRATHRQDIRVRRI